MKKLISLLLVYAMVLSFSGCGSDNAAKEDTSTTEKITEEENTSKDTQEEVKEEPEEEKLITAAELDAKLAEQPIVITELNVVPEGNDTFLETIIQNNSGTDIKDLVIGYVAWDENGLPVPVRGNSEYYLQADAKAVNLVEGGVCGKDFGYLIDKNSPIKSFKAIIVKYTDFEGKQWSNPCLSDFYKLYKGKRLKDIK